ncbi:hypothetical protein D3C87_1105160 [compost metagenome]
MLQLSLGQKILIQCQLLDLGLLLTVGETKQDLKRGDLELVVHIILMLHILHLIIWQYHGVILLQASFGHQHLL